MRWVRWFVTAVGVVTCGALLVACGGTASNALTRSQRTAVAAWAGTYGGHIVGIVDDSGTLGQSKHNAQRLTGCLRIAADTRAAKRLPPIPLSSAEQNWRLFLRDVAAGSRLCISGLRAQNAVWLDRAAKYFDRSAKPINAIQHLFDVVGRSFATLAVFHAWSHRVRHSPAPSPTTTTTTTTTVPPTTLPPTTTTTKPAPPPTTAPVTGYFNLSQVKSYLSNAAQSVQGDPLSWSYSKMQGGWVATTDDGVCTFTIVNSEGEPASLADSIDLSCGSPGISAPFTRADAGESSAFLAGIIQDLVGSDGVSWLQNELDNAGGSVNAHKEFGPISVSIDFGPGSLSETLLWQAG